MPYSAKEIAECLYHFRLINNGQQSDESSTATTPEWWPCLRCDNFDMVSDICKRVDYLMNTKSKLERDRY